jgi:hypothetical protein
MSQAKPHVPVVHDAREFGPDGQALLHAPQFATEFCVFVSQPSLPDMLQSPHPESHAPI